MAVNDSQFVVILIQVFEFLDIFLITVAGTLIVYRSDIVSPKTMNLSDRSLLTKLAVVLLVKVVLLVGLWWCFVRDDRVTVDSGAQAERWLSTVQQPTQGAKHDF